jgi:hypothetical protein
MHLLSQIQKSKFSQKSNKKYSSLKYIPTPSLIKSSFPLHSLFTSSQNILSHNSPALNTSSKYNNLYKHLSIQEPSSSIKVTQISFYTPKKKNFQIFLNQNRMNYL